MSYNYQIGQRYRCYNNTICTVIDAHARGAVLYNKKVNSIWEVDTAGNMHVRDKFRLPHAMENWVEQYIDTIRCDCGMIISGGLIHSDWCFVVQTKVGE